MKEAPSGLEGKRKAHALWCEGSVYSAQPLPGSQSQHLWFPLSPAPEIAEMRCSWSLILRQRSHKGLEEARCEVGN